MIGNASNFMEKEGYHIAPSQAAGAGVSHSNLRKEQKRKAKEEDADIGGKYHASSYYVCMYVCVGCMLAHLLCDLSIVVLLADCDLT